MHDPTSSSNSGLSAEVQARLAAIVAGSDDAIVSKDLNGIVQSWNAAAERIFGYTAEEMIGKPIALLVPENRPDEEPSILARLRRGERIDHFETIRRRKDGQLIDVSVTISPIRDASGKVVGASKIARDITALKRYMQEREDLLRREQQARQQAEQANRTKDEFLATLSHELRTPLNSILGWAHLLRMGMSSAADVSQGLETIERNARHQAHLIDELLDMSRIISGKLRLNVQPVDLKQIMSDALESVRPAAQAKNITVVTELEPEAAGLRGDPDRLQQVMWNLLSNAVKFTPEGGRINIRLRREDGEAVITVADTGEGIAADFLPHLFSRFTQADQTMTRRHQGLGLGLAIVRHLVELHGGTVSASSAGEGQGATFTVRLPVGYRPTAEEPAAGEAGRETPLVDLTGIRVLAVDDEPDARELIRRVLELNRATVITAGSAEQAIETLKRERPHVLLCDISMPGEDGYQLLSRVRRLPASEGRDTPAVALTAFARPEDRRRALLAGFQMHVPKPVEPAELLAVIANLSSTRTAQDPN